MLIQTTNGIRCNVARVTGSSSDLAAIAAVLEGRVEIYTLVGEPAGTEKKGIVLNPIGFSAGKKTITNSYMTCGIVLKHMNPAKTFKDIVAHVKGVWNAGYTSESVCTYVNGFKATSRGE
jgi:hypothetical protein